MAAGIKNRGFDCVGHRLYLSILLRGRDKVGIGRIGGQGRVDGDMAEGLWSSQGFHHGRPRQGQQRIQGPKPFPQ